MHTLYGTHPPTSTFPRARARLVVAQMAERDTAVTLTLRRAPDGGAVSSAGHGAPLELVVLSRWPGAMVDWNGEEVIL